MTCFRDMTFCADSMADAKVPCVEKRCHRYFSAETRVAARRWWSHDPDNAPIAFSHFAETCPDYKPQEPQE